MNTNARRTIGQIAIARLALLTLASNLLIGATNAQTFSSASPRLYGAVTFSGAAFVAGTRWLQIPCNPGFGLL